eukprot:COSAG01_NODE_26358_length_716_cov_1.766613_1_plen_104_part_00
MQRSRVEELQTLCEQQQSELAALKSKQHGDRGQGLGQKPPPPPGEVPPPPPPPLTTGDGESDGPAPLREMPFNADMLRAGMAGLHSCGSRLSVGPRWATCTPY